MLEPSSQPGPFLELKYEPNTENLNISAPLNVFLFNMENLAEISKFRILDLDSSVSKPSVYFSIGVK